MQKEVRYNVTLVTV